MRILLLTHSFNSLTQRLYVELDARGHELSVEFDINDTVTEEAIELFRPDLVIAPYLRRAIPESVWRSHVCLIVHPGIRGDRGPSALDWAILEEQTEWGVTVLQADAEMDAGDIWAHAEFPMRKGTKSSLYRREVTAAAVEAVLSAIGRYEAGNFTPEPLDYARDDIRGTWHPLMKQEDRAIDWQRDTTETVLRKIRAADGFPGVFDEIDGRRFALFDAHRDDTLSGEPGALIGRRHHAVCRASVDGAVWITHLKPILAEERSFKQPALSALGATAEGLPETPEPREGETWREIFYEESGGVGFLHFPFYNGAMSTDQCHRLEAAYREACGRDTRVIVLMGGEDFWSNGLHLGAIEAADSPAVESWRNINAIDDLCRAILLTESHLTVAAIRGNAGAGGVFLGLAADRVVAASNGVFNPHYKNMGNLYGSEYWTYLLPQRVGADGIDRVMGRRLPVGAREALDLGLIDECLDGDPAKLEAAICAYASGLAQAPDFVKLLERKVAKRKADEAEKPLESYREKELEQMRFNFFGFDPSYHGARYNFIRKVPVSRTPLFLAAHRRRLS